MAGTLSSTKSLLPSRGEEATARSRTHQGAGNRARLRYHAPVYAMPCVRILPAAALLLGSCVMWPPSGEAGQIDYKTARSERTLPAVRSAGAIKIDRKSTRLKE